MRLEYTTVGRDGVLVDRRVDVPSTANVVLFLQELRSAVRIVGTPVIYK